MRFLPVPKFFWIVAAVFLIAPWSPPAAEAHFIWLRIDAADEPGETTIQAFFNEEPDPDASFIKFVSDVPLTVETSPHEPFLDA